MDQITKKHKVAESVLDLIDNDEILGIGSGSTVNILIQNLPKINLIIMTHRCKFGVRERRSWSTN